MTQTVPPVVAKLTTAKKAVRILDWVFAFALTAYGLYRMDWFFLLLGGLSFALAIYNPAKRVERQVQAAVEARARVTSTPAPAVPVEQKAD